MRKKIKVYTQRNYAESSCREMLLDYNIYYPSLFLLFRAPEA